MMKVTFDFPTSLLSFALFASASLLFGCSNSGSSGDDGGSQAPPSSGPDASPPVATPDGGATSSTPDSSAATPDSSAATPDSSATTPDSSATSTPDAGTGTEGDSGALSFATDIYAPILAKHCTGCHAFKADGGAGAGITAGKLDFSSADAGYANLVNVAAAGVACGDTDGASPLVRVVPGHAAASLLYEKVNGFTVAPPCGSPMPKSGEIPDGGQEVVVEQVKTWINQGALP
jgi:hypothetical protein